MVPYWAYYDGENFNYYNWRRNQPQNEITGYPVNGNVFLNPISNLPFWIPGKVPFNDTEIFLENPPINPET
jgi:hypothetical protein